MKKIAIFFEFKDKLQEHHISAYAAQTAYFLVLSFIPFIMLLCTLVEYIPTISKSLMLKIAVDILPTEIDAFAISIIDEMFEKSAAILPISAIITAWSAGKGAMAITRGLNCMNENNITIGYIRDRIKGVFYTIIFVFSIVLALIGVVFGNNILVLVEKHFPLLEELINVIQSYKNFAVTGILIILFTIMFKYMPSGKVRRKIHHLPGAVFAAIAWTLFSYAFSVYIRFSAGFSSMYGSLTTLILVMMWLYISMYIMFIGAEINLFFEDEINYLYRKIKR